MYSRFVWVPGRGHVTVSIAQLSVSNRKTILHVVCGSRLGVT